jgi:ACS family hexuronate transporter-like MFS transporter
MWVAILAVAVAASAHQAWLSNVFALPGGVFARSAVGSVAGIGSFAGAMAGVVFQRSIGRILDANGGDYTPIFAACGGAYLVALTLVHLLIPRWQPAPMTSPPASLAASPAACT